MHHITVDDQQRIEWITYFVLGFVKGYSVLQTHGNHFDEIRAFRAC